MEMATCAKLESEPDSTTKMNVFFEIGIKLDEQVVIRPNSRRQEKSRVHIFKATVKKTSDAHSELKRHPIVHLYFTAQAQGPGEPVHFSFGST